MLSQNKFLAFFRLARPYQWHKNVFVLAPFFFSGNFSPQKIYLSALAFISFVIASSSVYSFNDVFDAEEDKKHPLKKQRPIAAGLISKNGGIIFSILLLIPAFTLGLYLKIGHFIIAYFLMNFLYSLLIKNKKPLDVIFVSLGFVIRVFAGGKAIDVVPSEWLISSTFFIALFISSMKKEAEAHEHSKVYEHMGVISAALTIFSYTMYIIERKNFLLLISVLPVVFGIMRYYIIAEENKGKDPSKLLLDKEIILAGIIWIIIFLIFGFSLFSCSEKPQNEEECKTVYYKDFDRDGFSDGVSSCVQLEGFFPPDELKSTYGDCNDNDPYVFPGSTTGSIICGNPQQSS